uniref:Nucleoside hydrolase n=1 Tax=Roseihalotalea indica TaxID=2867963 RepID=A0AA49GKM4_9BACT|nr:nucleoside hydrolase [Tunicatimonas sp. TK19036]
MKKYALLSLYLLLRFHASAQTPIILDADTGNEMDDLYAIVSAILSDSLEVKALTSAHFNNPQLLTDSMWNNYPTENINTVQLSQDENLKLLSSLNQTSIPHPLGANRMVGYAWGYYPGAPIPHSAATDYMIDQAQKASPKDKLTIVSLGAATNVAAAILTDTTIARNIRLYMLSMQYDLEKKAWNKNEFNVRNDLNALDLVLNHPELEVYIIPASIAGQLVFQRTSTIEKLRAIDTETTRILARRWDEVHAGDNWNMWDLALIEAIINPELATLEEGSTPPENTPRTINIYTHINAPKMEAAFWERLSQTAN